MTSGPPPTLLVAAIVFALLWLLLKVWRVCHQAAARWRLGCAVKWFVILLGADLLATALPFTVTALLLSKVPGAWSYTTPFVALAAGAAGSTAVRRNPASFLRHFAGLRKRVNADHKSLEDHITLQIKQVCLDESAKWIEEVALPALRGRDITAFIREVKLFVGHAPCSSQRQQTQDVRDVQRWLHDGNDSSDEDRAAACNRMLMRGGRRRLQHVIQKIGSNRAA